MIWASALNHYTSMQQCAYFRRKHTIDPFMPNELFYIISSDRSIFIITMYSENFVFHVNSVDPDQKPLSAASDLGPHSLPMSLLCGVRRKWVK